MDPERLRPQREDAKMQRPDREPRMQSPGDGSKEGPPAPNQTSGGRTGAKSSGGFLLKILAVVLLAVAGWFYFGNSPAVYTGPDDLAPNYQKNKNSNPNTPAVFAAKDIDHAKTDAVKAAALRGDVLPGILDPSPAFMEAARKGEVTFYAVRVYDTCAEDGDVVTIQIPIGGRIGPIPLTIAGTTISIPVVSGQPAQVTIVAEKDGVGGVTLGAQTSTGIWYSSVLPVGGTETMLLSVQ